MRDGRRQRLGLATGTANPNEEDVSTTGIDSLINMGDLYTNSVADQNATTGNEAYLDRILDEQGPDTLNLDPGAYVDTRDNRYINDAYNYYLGGGTGEVPEATVAPDFTGGELIDTSGEGQVDIVDQLGPITTDITSDQIDEVALTGGTTGGVTNDNITVENIAQNQTPYDVPMDPSNPGASIENIIAQQNQTIPDDPSIDAFDINEVGDPSQNPGSINVGDQPMAAGPFDYLQEPSISTIANPEIFDDYAGVNDPQVGDPGFENYTPSFEPEQQGIIEQAFSKVGSTAENIMNDLSQIPGAVVDFANQTVDILGKKINVGSTLLKAGINRIVGGPISLVFDAVSALAGMLPEGGRSDMSDALGEQYGMDDIGRLTGGPMEGYSVGPDFAQTVQDRIDNINETLSNMTSEQLATTTLKDRVENLKEIKAETIAAGTGGVITEPGTVLGPGEFLPEGEELVTKEEQDAINRVESFKDYEGVNVQGDGSEMLDDAQGVDVETADIQDYADIYEPPAPAPISVPVPAHISGGGGGGGGANIGGGQQTSSGGAGGFSSGQGGGWGWNKGGIVSLKNAKR